MKKNKLVKLVKIPKIFDECDLCFMQVPTHIDFPIKRVYYILNRTSGKPRGHHAHKTTDQVLFCIQGSIKIVLDNGKKKETVTLNKPNIGVLIKRKIWHEMKGFKKETILLVLASKIYNPSDYIRDYKDFISFVKKK